MSALLELNENAGNIIEKIDFFVKIIKFCIKISMDSLVQFPTEILLLIITWCDGLSLNHLSRTSKAFHALMVNYLAEASSEELLRKTIPIHEQCISDYYTYNIHYHRLPNAELHGKFEIYDKFCRYEQFTLYIRLHCDKDCVMKTNKMSHIMLSSYMICESQRKSDGALAPLYKYMWKKICATRLIFCRIGIKRKRGQYH
jgi:hypothetical protein